MDGEDLPEFLAESPNFTASTDDIFSILEAFESSCHYNNNNNGNNGNTAGLVGSKDEYGDEPSEAFEFQNSLGNYSPFQESEAEVEASAASNSSKRQKVIVSNNVVAAAAMEDGQQKMSHITVERNRRKQMNEHLAVLRALMPCFYVKRGDQASIIGGVVNYITELQQILQALEAKKQRKAYAEALSPRLISSPRPSPHHPLPLSPRRPPLSPRLNLPISPRTPQPSNPYKPRLHNLQQPGFLNSPSISSPVDLSPCNSSTSSINELVASSKTAVAEVEVKFSGPNLLLKTASHRIRGQALKIISALEELALEILQMNISAVDETMLYSFTIKIGIDCQLSAEELAEQIQQTFC